MAPPVALMAKCILHVENNKARETLGLFPTKGYAEPPSPLRSGGNFMKDAECAVQYEKK